MTCIDMKINSALARTPQATSMARGQWSHSECATTCHGQARVPQILSRVACFGVLLGWVCVCVPASTDHVATYRAVVQHLTCDRGDRGCGISAKRSGLGSLAQRVQGVYEC